MARVTSDTYEKALNTKLGIVRRSGIADVSRKDLTKWYGKANAGAYADIRARWNELTDKEFGRLLCVQKGGTIYLIAQRSLVEVHKFLDR